MHYNNGQNYVDRILPSQITQLRHNSVWGFFKQYDGRITEGGCVNF